MMKSTILIADDAELNREILTEMLGDQYRFLYAENGAQAVEILSGGEAVDLVLLDLNMPVMDGFDVLRAMNQHGWITDIPVIIISSEDGSEFISEAYSLGVTDFISRPFHSVVVERRVENTLLMYSKQKRLIHLVEQQVFEREKVNNTMISIFSDIIEMRNRESGTHTLNVQTITHLLLTDLVSRTDRYSLSVSDISLISTLAALHDIGKIKIPESVLNKPGKLNSEEWELMKSHTIEGDAILSSSELDQSSTFVRTARSICRWHHEKYDGGGYPDGLAGDDIPIAAQVVSLADVYDALTSERCYKKAFSHETAIAMILNGECGVFNPLLLECLRAIEADLRAVEAGTHYDFSAQVIDVADEILSAEQLPQDNQLRRMLENERKKKDFFMECGGDVLFEFDLLLGKMVFTDPHEPERTKRTTIFTSRDNPNNILPIAYWDELAQRLHNAPHDNPVVTIDVELRIKGTLRPHRAEMMAIWPENGDNYICVIGRFIRLF